MGNAVQHPNATRSQTNKNLTDDEYPFENFAPTLAQCYFIVSVGYILAKVGPLSRSDVRGINAYASYFAMPAIICVSIADADLGRDFHWQLLLGIVAGKAVIFAAVAVAAACLNKPVDLVFAGIHAMFSVQCNDLPVGNPLISSLYRFVRPHMTKYLFFLPSLTVIVFGPISHLMIGTANKTSSDADGVEESNGDRKAVFAKTVGGIFRNSIIRYISKNLLQNPVIIATATGLLLNLIFGAKMPAVLRHPIHVLAQTIPGIALCVLGFGMIGKERFLISSSLIPALVLVFVKMVLTPLILHVTVKSLAGRAPFTKELCDFALLYGIISPAAVIFEEAKRKNIHTAAMGAALIISSLSSFPLSYAVAKWTIVRPEAQSVYVDDISNVSFQVSCLSIACGASTLCIIWCKKFGSKRMSAHLSIQGLVLFQLAIASGALLKRLVGIKSRWLHYLHLAVSTYGEIGIYVWTCIFVIVMMLQRRMILVLKHSSLVIVMATCGTSLLITSVVVAMKSLGTKRKDSDRRCVIEIVDHNQLILTTSVLAVCFAVTCLAFYRQRSSWSNGREVINSNVYFIGEGQKEITENRNDNVSKWMHEASKSTSALFPEAEMNTYHEYVNATDHDFVQLCGPKWSRRILSLLILQMLVMSSRLLANAYKLYDCTDTTVIVPLEYLQNVIFFGQGVIPFLIFGINLRTLSFSIVKWFRKVKYGADILRELTPEEQESVDSFCSYFLSNQYSRCFANLARDRMWKGSSYKNCFWGHQMTQWLIASELAKTSQEAEDLGQKLLFGRLIQHVNCMHNFHDAPYLYCFPMRECSHL